MPATVNPEPMFGSRAYPILEYRVELAGWFDKLVLVILRMDRPETGYRHAKSGAAETLNLHKQNGNAEAVR